MLKVEAKNAAKKEMTIKEDCTNCKKKKRYYDGWHLTDFFFKY